MASPLSGRRWLSCRLASSRALWTARLREALTVPRLLSVPRTARNGAADQPLAAAALGDLPLVVLTRIPSGRLPRHIDATSEYR